MGDKKRRKKQGRATPQPQAPPPDLPPRRSMEKMMADLGKLLSQQEFSSIEEANAFLQDLLASSGGVIPASTPSTPLERAQDLMYDAWEASGKRQIELARQALAISPDCADAYVLLAEHARSVQEAKDLYEQGVQAGERALGPQVFTEDVGHFWGIIETRPYMRAREGLAQCLWLLGERQQAIAHYQDMLRLNPGDNQGIRYVLINCLLAQGDDQAVEQLLKQYPDDAAATWAYARALWLFRREGAGRRANAALKKALKANRFVPAYLLGKKKLPRSMPAYIGFGDETEAIDYAAGASAVWRETPGALEWLASHTSTEGQ